MTVDVLAEAPCNLCGGRAVTVLAHRSRSGAPLRTVACRRCGLVWSDPRPHDVRHFYETDYRLTYKRAYQPKPKHVLRAGGVALSRMEKIRPYLRSRMRVLDVGSGGGEFAYLLRSLGHDVCGVEPNRGYADYSANQYGLDVVRGFVTDVDLPSTHYDLITIWHVLEHTEDPLTVIKRLAGALRPDGVLVVEVPNVEATCQSPASTFHEAHLYNFNAATLGLLAAKCGLYTRSMSVASDGGNLTALFTPLPVADGTALPGNHDRISSVVSRHTPLPHYASLHPYRRFVKRMIRGASEWIASRRAGGARESLDRLFAPALTRPERSLGAKLDWKVILATYAAALLLEWVLLDKLPANGWSESRGLGVYVALQCLMVAGVVRMMRVPMGSRSLYGVGAWAVPLFALPIYC